MNPLLINEKLQSTSKDISLDNGINKNKTHTQSAYKTLHADIVKKKPTNILFCSISKTRSVKNKCSLPGKK